MILVLDDAHLLREPQALDALRLLAQHVAPARRWLSRRAASWGCRWVACDPRAWSRSSVRRTWPWTRTKPRRSPAGGTTASPAEVTLIFRRTEGWPAGLRLAALAKRRTTRARPALFRGGRPLRRRLPARRAARPPRPRRRRLPHPHLAAGTADRPAVRLGAREAQVGSGARDLAHANFLLAPIDRSSSGSARTRCSPTCSGWAPSRRQTGRPRSTAGPARGTSSTTSSTGRSEHAAAGGDDERAGALLWRLTPSYAASGRAEALGGWLDGFGDARISMHPTLSLSAAVHRLMHEDRDRAERWADAAEGGSARQRRRAAARRRPAWRSSSERRTSRR